MGFTKSDHLPTWGGRNDLSKCGVEFYHRANKSREIGITNNINPHPKIQSLWFYGDLAVVPTFLDLLAFAKRK
jgi:hypothetical protein